MIKQFMFQNNGGGAAKEVNYCNIQPLSNTSSMLMLGIIFTSTVSSSVIVKGEVTIKGNLTEFTLTFNIGDIMKPLTYLDASIPSLTKIISITPTEDSTYIYEIGPNSEFIRKTEIVITALLNSIQSTVNFSASEPVTSNISVYGTVILSTPSGDQKSPVSTTIKPGNSSATGFYFKPANVLISRTVLEDLGMNPTEDTYHTYRITK